MILSKKEKIEFLRNIGWRDLWSEDNWIHPDLKDRTDIDIDRAGISLESAYNAAINKKELDEFKQLPFNEMWKKMYGKD